MTPATLPTSATQLSELSGGAAKLINRGAGSHSPEAKQAAQKAAEEFETVFLNTMFQSMFEGVKAEAPFGGGYGEQVYRSMMVNQYANDLSASGGIGLADAVAREILAQQEASNS